VLRLARPRQWTKNLLVFAALVFARKLFVWDSLATAIGAFAVFCLASSSVYFVNDVMDAERDRRHPDKRRRPVAAGLVSPAAALTLGIALTASSLALAVGLRPAFGAAIALYLAISHAYSLGAKNIVIVDAMLIATGFVLRAVGGALAIDVPSSGWFVLCTFFGALFLALSKRRGEIFALELSAGDHRRVLDRYDAATLQTYTGATMATVILTYALYVMDMIEQGRVHGPIFAATLLFVVFGVFRYHLLVEETTLGDKPEEVLLQDRPTQLCALGFSLTAVAALYLGG
jgi:4-hydroxybenzoate polyprenyltransferase